MNADIQGDFQICISVPSGDGLHSYNVRMFMIITKWQPRISLRYDSNWIQCQICFEFHKAFHVTKHIETISFQQSQPQKEEPNIKLTKQNQKMYGLKWEETLSDFSKTTNCKLVSGILKVDFLKIFRLFASKCLIW